MTTRALRTRGCITSCATASLLLMVGVLAQPAATVPSQLLLKVDLRAIDFVGQLIEVGVPAGIEIRGGSGMADYTVIAPMAGRQNVLVGQIVDAFNRQHRESHAEWRDDAVVLRPPDDRTWLLDADVSLRSEEVADVEEGIKVVLSAFDGTIKRGGLRIGPMPAGPTGPLYTAAMLGPIQIPSGRMTVLTALNALVRQLKGHAWVVMTEKQRGSTVVTWVGVLRRQGSLLKIRFNDPKRPRV